MAVKDHAYSIDLLQLKENEDYEFDYHIDREFFAARENSDVLDCDVEVHLTLRRRHESYALEFAFDGALAVPCDRCLDPVEVPVATDYDVTVKYGEEYDDSADDIIEIPYSMTRFDVAPLIYDTLLLEIPLRCVHPDGECNLDMDAALRRHNEENHDEVDEN